MEYSQRGNSSTRRCRPSLSLRAESNRWTIQSSPFNLFTNDNGEFTLIDLDAGSYRLTIIMEPPSVVEIEVPDDPKRVLDFGVLSVRPVAR